MSKNHLFVGAALALLVASPAASQSFFERERNVSVEERPRPQFTPAGINVGGLSVYPKLNVSLAHDDNVFGERTRRDSDTYLRLAPQVLVVSNWSRHQIKGLAQVATASYSDLSSEDSTTWLLQGSGRMDMAVFSSAALLLRQSRQVEARTAANSPLTARDPVKYDVTDAQLDLILGGSRSRLILSGGAVKRNYQNARSQLGVTIDQSFRDVNIYTQSAKAEYGISPAISLFARYEHNERDYDYVPLGGLDRNSTGSRTMLGASFDRQSLTRGEVEVGYFSQTFRNRTIGEIEGLAVSGKLEWFPSPLTTVTLSGLTSAEDAAIVGSAGYRNTEAELKVDHELLRNLILTGRLGYGKQNYRGIDRLDDQVSSTVAARYLLNRTWSAGVDFTHAERTSGGAQSGRAFTDNLVRVTVGYGL